MAGQVGICFVGRGWGGRELEGGWRCRRCRGSRAQLLGAWNGSFIEVAARYRLSRGGAAHWDIGYVFIGLYVNRRLIAPLFSQKLFLQATMGDQLSDINHAFWPDWSTHSV